MSEKKQNAPKTEQELKGSEILEAVKGGKGGKSLAVPAGPGKEQTQKGAKPTGKGVRRTAAVHESHDAAPETECATNGQNKVDGITGPGKGCRTDRRHIPGQRSGKKGQQYHDDQDPAQEHCVSPAYKILTLKDKKVVKIIDMY